MLVMAQGLSGPGVSSLRVPSDPAKFATTQAPVPPPYNRETTGRQNPDRQNPDNFYYSDESTSQGQCHGLAVSEDLETGRGTLRVTVGGPSAGGGSC